MAPRTRPTSAPRRPDGACAPRREPTLAAVVPATDEPPTLERCLAALRAGGRAPDELIVQRGPGGAGPAAARNAGAARASSDVLVFVDSDVEVHPDALVRVGARFAAEPGLSALFGAYDDRPEAPGRVSRFRNLLHHHVHASSPGPAETFWAGLGAVRRDAFEAAGGFDARRFPHPSVEDVELGMRLRRGGHAIALDPRLRGRHLKAWSLRSMLFTDFSRRGVPWARLLLESGRAGTALNLGWRNRVSAAASVLLALAVLWRRPRAAVAALLAVLALNRSLYALLARRGGAGLAVAGVPLHLLHQLAAVAAVPVALVLHLRSRLASRGDLLPHMGSKSPEGGR